ncbi:hypothetical protein PA25_33770 [Pseudoalteromonas sp. A25]|nr:hypothetical protein PA25_33770 [Pseudoalteromonas sp. A25]
MSIMFSFLVLPIFVTFWLFSGAQLPTENYYTSATISGLIAALGSVSFIRALAIGKMAIILPMLSFTPVWSAMLAWLWLNEPLSTSQALAILTITLGSFWVLGGKLKATEKGVGHALLAALCWGSCIVLDKYALQYATKEFHATYITLIVFFATSLLLKIIVKPQVVKMRVKWWLFATVCFSGAVIFQFIAIEQLQPGLVEGLKRGVGILSALFIGFLLYKETLSAKQLMAIGLIIVSTLVLVY